MSILNSVQAATAPAAAVTPIKSAADRKSTQFWINVGINVPGIGENGEAVFVSLPMGIPLDDMKAVTVKGTSLNYVQLQQTKNALLEAAQGAAARLAPGERRPMPEFTVEFARVAAPDQQGSAQDNPLLAGLLRSIKGE